MNERLTDDFIEELYEEIRRLQNAIRLAIKDIDNQAPKFARGVLNEALERSTDEY